VPLHTWLPLAHVQAPTAGSVFLAGVLLKIGAYGLLRFSIPMLPEATLVYAPWLLWASLIGIIYGSLVALAQSDIKRLIAYSSVAHMGFCVLGLFALNALGIGGGALQMVNHGLSTGALFAIVGMLYERYHTREIASFGGLARKLPRLAACMVLFTFASIGLPGLNGFASEFLLLAGMFQKAWTDAPPAFDLEYRIIAVASVAGVVLGAWYMLWLVQRVFFGPVKEPSVHDETENTAEHHAPIADLNVREGLALAPLAILAVWIGLAPQFFLERMDPSLRQTLSHAEAAEDSVARPSLASVAHSEPNRSPPGD
jgi:NADH-quinone oxidoreductase subunit M